MRAEDVLYEIGDQRESQTVEFKASLSLQKEAIQAMVAFANAQGGWLFFGVTDEGAREGVQIGADTLEKLAAAIRDHTYPTLPVVIEAIPSRDKSRHIIGVEVPADVPPAIGVYLYSSERIPTDREVDATTMQAFRRVGRVTQKEDFMRMRQPLALEPRVVMYLNGAGRTAGAPFPRKQEFYYTNSGTGWAFNVAFRASHSFYQVQAGPEGISLPPWEQQDPLNKANRQRGTVEVVNPTDDGPADEPVILTATCTDEHGLTWESSLEMSPVIRGDGSQSMREFAQGRYSRRIVVLPPKSS